MILGRRMILLLLQRGLSRTRTIGLQLLDLFVGNFPSLCQSSR